MTVGPLEYVVIGFPDLNVDGSVAAEIETVVRSGTIRIVDLVAIAKDEDGDVAVIELDAKDDPRYAGFAPLLSNRMGLFTAEDLATIALEMPERHGRAGDPVRAPLGGRHQERDGRQERRADHCARCIPPEVLEELNDELEAAMAEALPAGG